MLLEEGLVVFNSTHDAIKAESVCNKNGVEASLIPTHPSISLGCGFMLRTKWENFKEIVKILEKEEIKYKALYYSTKKGIKRETELLFENEG